MNQTGKWVNLFSSFVLVIISCEAVADGIMIPDAKAARRALEQALIKEPEQKAVIFFRNGVEQLIISPSYEGATDRFAWVVPVPARPKVEIVEGAIFHELAEITTFQVMSMGPASGEKSSRNDASVRVLERKTVGSYDVSVLSAGDGAALMKWLSGNGYHLPQKAAKPVKIGNNRSCYHMGNRYGETRDLQV
ncbi:MAG: DUF2330 domain-containing protein [Armatimonadetes bacterium]|nr:DUF2330 domain-containing protein [Armatimonadota bacterium]